MTARTDSSPSSSCPRLAQKPIVSGTLTVLTEPNRGGKELRTRIDSNSKLERVSFENRVGESGSDPAAPTLTTRASRDSISGHFCHQGYSFRCDIPCKVKGHVRFKAFSHRLNPGPALSIAALGRKIPFNVVSVKSRSYFPSHAKNCESSISADRQAGGRAGEASSQEERRMTDGRTHAQAEASERNDPP